MMRLTVSECISQEFVRVLGTHYPILNASHTTFAVFEMLTITGRFCGLVTRNDIAQHPNSTFAECLFKFKNRPVLTLELTICQALTIMEQEKITTLAVTNADHHFIGIIMQSHLMHALYQFKHALLRQEHQSKIYLAKMHELLRTQTANVQNTKHNTPSATLLTGSSQFVLIRDKLTLYLQGNPPHNQGAVFIVNLDNFSTINNLLNSYLGDLLLQQVGMRLSAELGMHDTVSRQGGDEFILILCGLDSIYPTQIIADNILDSLTAPFQIDNQTIYISASIGISFYSPQMLNPSAALANANTALVQAKACGKNNYQYFTEELGERTKKIQRIEERLHHVLERKELFLCYQPIVDLHYSNIVAMEALIRWQSPTLGLVMPADFISLTEKNDLIVPIGDWVLREACMQAARWQQPNRSLRISVNISAQQFHAFNGLGAEHLIKTIMAVLDESQLPPELLELEITESVMMKSPALSISAIKKLKDIGVRIACDDFGTGYSSLNFLKHFPIDVLKIDKLFIDDIANNSVDIAIIQAIISMAQKLHVDVIAEGIEDGEQMYILRNMGCHMIQGYYFSPPIKTEEANIMLHNGFQPMSFNMEQKEIWHKQSWSPEQAKQPNNK